MKRLMQLGVPVGIVFIVVMLVVPLPAILLDLLIAMNITGALLIPADRDVHLQAVGLRRVSRR